MNIDLIPNGAIKRVHVSQNDVGRTLTFELFNNSTSYTVPSGAVVKIQGTKPSGFGFSETCTVSGNVATIDTTEAMTDESGNIQTELSISYGDVVIGTSNFVLAVEKNPHPDTTTDGSMETIIPELTLLVNEVKGYAEEIEGTYHAYGSPWVASTVAQMTDTDKIYVYVGSESGYTNGNWYYYNGSSWVSGGVYNAVAVQTDTTLSVSDMPADAKVVGDEVSDLKSDLGVCFDGGFISVPLTYTDGGYINNTNGEVISYSGWKYTDFVDISDRENDTIYVSTEAPSSTLYNGFYNSEHTFIKAFNANAGEISDVPVSAKYVRFSNQSNFNASLSIYKMGYRKAVDELEEKIESNVEGIVVLNKDVEPYMIQTTAPRNIHLDDATKPKPLSFIHFSDIHTRQPLWNRVVEYGNKFSDYIDFIIHSGDYVGSYQGAYVDLYANGITPNIPLYNVVGNHDTYADASGTLASKASTYALIFNHRDNWNVTSFMTGNNSMTYYKKFTDSNVWVFVLDNYYDQEAQVAWLAERLNNALNDDAHVITVMHEVSRRIVDKLDTGFQTLNDYESVGGNGGNSQGVERISPFDAVIANFINNGGHFVANLVGHEHSDMIGYTSTGVLNIAVECATDDVVWSDARREEGTKTWDAFNVFTVNPNTNTLAIVRIGDNSDTYGRPRNVLCYDYLNKQIITTH